MAIYEFKNYKEFIADTLEARSAEGASRKGLANFVGCQPSHISAVLSGDAHLSSEQAEKAARFLGLNKDQTEYFLLLVQYNCAGTKQLQNVYNSMLKQCRERVSPLKSKLGIEDDISDSDKAKYYFSWIYPCIHVMLSIKEFQTPKPLRLNSELKQAELKM